MKKLGEWDYYGACDPAHHNVAAGFMGPETFSVGIFQWVPKANSNTYAANRGMKHGPIIARFSGPTAHPEQVYAKARAFIAHLKEKAGQL